MRQKKILLIGASGFEQTNEEIRVECFPWDRIHKIQNIRDFDTVILDLLPFEDKINKDEVDWKEFYNLFSFKNAMDILMNNGGMIILGDPRFSIKFASDGNENVAKGKEVVWDFLFWTGIEFVWDDQPGDTLIFEDDYKHRNYEQYVNKINKWKYSLKHCSINENVAAERFDLERVKESGFYYRLEDDYFCRNRYNHAIAFSIWFEIMRSSSDRYSRDKVAQSYGPFIFLPKSDMNENEAIQDILTNICGIETNVPEPDWINGYDAPGQKKIDEEIRTITGELDNTLIKLQDANERKEEVRKCLKLLYEREYALEPTVRDIFRKLTAHVEDPTEKNKEDGWMLVNVNNQDYEGVLEIKSTRSDVFSEEGRKQLLDWIDRGRTMREKEYKGIFVGNSAVDKPLNERPWAFSDSWAKAAELSKICAIKTEDLYYIYVLYMQKLINIDEFWLDLFNTNGVFQIKKYVEKYTQKDAEEKV